MGFGDKVKQVGQLVQRTVSSNQDRIGGAVDTVGSVANKTTKGKFADQIAKVGEMAKEGVGKLSADGHTATETEGAADAEAGAKASGADDAAKAASSAEGAGEQEDQPSEPPASK